ncbi:MAG: hypothetical protein ACQEP1_02925 [Nanobdellota archaeon]
MYKNIIIAFGIGIAIFITLSMNFGNSTVFILYGMLSLILSATLFIIKRLYNKEVRVFLGRTGKLFLYTTIVFAACLTFLTLGKRTLLIIFSIFGSLMFAISFLKAMIFSLKATGKLK